MILIYQACYAPLWRQGFDKSEPYRELSNKQNKGDFHIPECRFPLIRNLDFIRQEYPPREYLDNKVCYSSLNYDKYMYGDTVERVSLALENISFHKKCILQQIERL